MNQSAPSVLVVGAGPTGLTLANSLQKQGVSFRIIDKLQEPARVSKALAVWSGSLEAFSALGVADDFIAGGIRLTNIRVGDGSHELAAMSIAEGVDSAFAFTLIVPQSKTEEILAAHLAQGGHAVERGVELVDYVEIGDTVRSTLRHPDGREETIDTLFLVGCDGARSIVRHKTGIAFEGYTEPQTFILSDTRIDGPLDSTSIYIWWSSAGSVALFPVVPGIWRTFAMRDEPAGEEPPTIEEIQAHLEASGPPGIKVSDATWLSTFRVNERLAAGYRKGRVFLAGDAAHIHSPAGGQGMNTGIQDAANLGWKIGAVLAGRGDAEMLLDSYEAERRPVAREVVAGAAQKLKFGMVTRGTATRLVRDALISVASRLPAIRQKLQVELSETEIRYSEGPLVEAVRRISGSATPRAGARALDLTLDGRSLWGHFSAARHTLLLFGPPGAHDRMRMAAARFADALDVVDLGAEPAAAARYGLHGAGWVLVRPDQFIAARDDADAQGAFDAYAQLALEPAR
ncbi:FAD-dependent monooxygenase [Aquabacter spiritensis]|uniref:2-polyprenyl-6-methoxyphenol hydroxylase-like FAD-dependent oxidoreductase n=1 Tax=Aquabacter spiritensis TaxID=933073 RepID=A0A4V2UYC5_9HYPH|nr:FAD-dependent monooxygenase [Aquabacter spiritensis]TCT06858.1 2-polyprenyl-6-methoxyphenol hydroxylase-like FAD-dependent oxidoreductase [Aquabacter spiritensis]